MLCRKRGNTSRLKERFKRRELEAQITRRPREIKAAGKTNLDPSSSHPSLEWRLIFSASDSRLTPKRSLDWLRESVVKKEKPPTIGQLHTCGIKAQLLLALPVPRTQLSSLFKSHPTTYPTARSTDNLPPAGTSITDSPKGSVCWTPLPDQTTRPSAPLRMGSSPAPHSDLEASPWRTPLPHGLHTFWLAN